jgi:serine/threonine-protein kinase RsbW
MQCDSRGSFASSGVGGVGDRQRWERVPDLHRPAVPAVADRLPQLRQALRDWARGAGLSREAIHDLVLACYEAMANVVTHAYPDSPGVLDLNASYAPAHGRVIVTVTDYGRWQQPARDPGQLHGRGVPMIRALAGHAEVEPGPQGTTVRMYWWVRD